MLLGQYFTQAHYRGHFYAKAQNLNRKLRAAYDAVLNSYDLLLMPTLPMKATPLPPPDAPRASFISSAHSKWFLTRRRLSTQRGIRR